MWDQRRYYSKSFDGFYVGLADVVINERLEVDSGASTASFPPVYEKEFNIASKGQKIKWKQSEAN